jgi:CubicO group peptidase (beta-lactamase class C family)
MSLEIAVAYAKRHAPAALLIERDGEIVYEDYDSGWNAEKPHALYSGAKSFWGVAALCAQTDGILALDETVGATFPSWNDDPVKRPVTLRMLLQLTSGIGFGGLGNTVPTYEKALAVSLKNPAGSTFTYSGIPLQVFGAVLAHKLASRAKTPHEYLRERVLDPIEMKIDSWRTMADGTQPLPTGAFVTAREWLKYGRFVAAGGFDEALRGSEANPRYGLGWWLGAPDAPDDLFYASGSGGQALYVSPSQRLVAVHYGNKTSYKHKAFLKRLFT